MKGVHGKIRGNARAKSGSESLDLISPLAFALFLFHWNRIDLDHAVAMGPRSNSRLGMAHIDSKGKTDVPA
jgi:hypothetical protein